MTSNWLRVRVAEIASPKPNALATGPFGSSISSKFFVEQGIPVIRGSNLSEEVGTRFFDEGLVFITPDKAATFVRSEAHRGDLVFTCWGTIGQVGLIDHRSKFDTYIVSNKQMKLTPDPEKADSLFLYYSFSSPSVVRAIQGQAIGSSVPGFNLGQLRNIELNLPPVPEQRRIAAVLGALDDKIELNRRMNRTLEAMAQALFKSWFVDFDGNNDLTDSALGPIPRGWTVRSLDEIADFLNGAACQKYPAIEGQSWLPVIKIRELNQGVTEQTDRATPDVPDKWHVCDGDVLFSWSGSLVVKIWTGGPGALNQHLFKVTSTAYPRWFYLLWVQRHLAEFQQIAADKATTMGHIKRHHLTDAKCAVPPANVLARMGSLMDPIVARQIGNELESRTLAELRDTLLPKLISGELRVPEAEELVEAAS